MFESFVFLKGDNEMDFSMPVYKTGVTEEQKQFVMDIDGIIQRTEEKPAVPIFELKADEEARERLKNHQNEIEYENLVAKVKEWEILLADKDIIDHQALAVLLDDKILFDELKRSHKVLDDTYAYITKETNKWEQHESMYDSLLNDIRDESDKCEEARNMLARLM